MVDLFKEFEELESNTQPIARETIIKAPFPYPGGKSRSIHMIGEQLPYRDTYVSVFGGSGCDILARRTSKLEVYNDKYGGVVDFYRCLKDPILLEQLIEQIDLTIHSREDFIWCKETWEDQATIVQRASRWYYMLTYSFASLGRNFGRATSSKSRFAGKLRDKIPLLPIIHERFKYVQVENQDWEQCVIDYDSPTTVFYMDPPFIDADSGIYPEKMKRDVHRHLIDVIFSLKGFVAVSGYANPLYDNQVWDNRFEWDVYMSVKAQAFTSENWKKDRENNHERNNVTEVLWIKESK